MQKQRKLIPDTVYVGDYSQVKTSMQGQACVHRWSTALQAELRCMPPVEQRSRFIINIPSQSAW